MKKEPKWIEFKDVTDQYNPDGKRKTKVFFVYNKEYGTRLGMISWHGPFRKYSFFPEANMVFEATCLQDIIDFMNGLMEERKFPLKRGTTKCPNCNKGLHFNSVEGMRIVYNDVYRSICVNAACENYKKTLTVTADAQT